MAVRLVECTISCIIEVLYLELGLVQQLWPDAQVFDIRIVSGCFQIVFRIIKGVIRYKMMLNTVDSHSHRFLEQTPFLELVGIHE